MCTYYDTDYIAISHLFYRANSLFACIFSLPDFQMCAKQEQINVYFPIKHI